ncbi:diguanylate cyclase [Thermodesulfobacteriota bacterium]
MGSHVLIVDDNTEISESMQEFLNMTGYHSDTADSAEEALDLLKTNDFHVVITDIKLPGMSGLELTDLIKEKYDLDIVVMTGFSKDYSYEEAISRGATDFVFKPVRLEELLLRLKRMQRERELAKDRDNMLEKFQRLAITDELTTLYNSRYFYSQLEVEVDRSNRYKHPLALLLMDIDHFKRYNDTHGHLEGDKVLVRFSGLIRSCLRAMDSAYRYGGEEFTVILPATTGQEAITVAERIRKVTEAEKMFRGEKQPKRVTVSIGMTEYIRNEKLSSFVQRADKAMYNSKQNGRNQVSYLFSDST